MSTTTRTRPFMSRDMIEHRNRRVVQLTREGESVAYIARLLNISERHVIRIRHQHGIAKPTPPPITPEELARAAQLLADGASRTETARTIGRSTRVIEKYFPGQRWTRRQMDEHLTSVRRFKKLMAS